MHQSTRLSSRVVVAMMAMLTMAMTAWAGVPNTPENFAAYATSNDGFGGAYMIWTPADETADGFRVYMSTDDGATWQINAELLDSGGTRRWYHATDRLPNGTYDFQVTAFNEDGESARSNTSTVVLDGRGVRFVGGYNADSVTRGTPVERDFDAESSDGSDIVYSLVDAADGMTIDAQTGMFSWTPTTVGHYTVQIKAALAGDPTVSASTYYIVMVTYGPNDLCAMISGTVTDQANNPVPYGQVAVMVMSGGQTINLTGPIVNGHFDIAVPEATMILHVSGDFRSEYYNNSQVPETAERLTLVCGDQRTLSITVEPNPVSYHGRIFGALIDTADNFLSGQIIAYRIDTNDVPVQAAETWARGGYFEFNQLEPGEYVIWGSSLDTMHVPGYHRANQIAALTWTEATRIDLRANDSAFGATIELVYIEGGGQARLRGTVVSEGGRIRKQEDPHILGATPVEGATVYALDQANSVAGYATTDAAGRFEIWQIKEGTYTILVDKVGLRPLYEPVGVKDNVVTEIDLTMTSVTSSVANAATGATALAIYPNPVNASAMVRFNATAGTTHLKLIDLRGSEVVSMSIETVTGENSVRLETAALPAGMYLLQIGSGSGSVSTMITVAR